MKILGIVPYRFLPAQIGGQKAIEQLYRSLGERTDVSVVSVQSNDEAFAKNFVLYRFFSNRFLRYGNVFYVKKLTKLIVENGITHLFVEHPYMGWMGLYLQRKLKIPLYVHSHNIESLRFKSVGKKWWKILWHYERYVYRKATGVFFITENDRQFAVQQYGVKPDRAFTALYGTEISEAPLEADRQTAKQTICNKHNISANTTLLLFNGSFDYAPNALALQTLIDTVVPVLQTTLLPFQLLICGRNIPVHLKQKQTPQVLFLDYVDDILLYNKAADVFVNPVLEGGGIKTKLVEALAAGANAVSTQSGATGVEDSWCNGKLYITPDGDWQAFAVQIIKAASNKNEMSAVFYQHFYIGNIAGSVLQTISR